MPRARSKKQDDRQTAALYENGSGCLSIYSLSILSAMLIICLITVLALKAPMNTLAAAPVNSISSANATNLTNILSISPIFTREVQYWAPDITRWANAAALDPNLVAVIMQIESCGDPSALSRAGALGLFQVMPFHFHFGENPYNSETNALRGVNYLARSLQAANGDARLALAGYNGGIGVISLKQNVTSTTAHPFMKMRTVAQPPAPCWMNGIKSMEPVYAGVQAKNWG